MSNCFYCENGKFLEGLMIEICELENSTVYLNRDQKHLGRCIVKFKDHKNEYFELTAEENQGYFKEVAAVSKAIYELYNPNKINYATFGDGVPHVHMHIVPKYKDGLNWGQPFDDSLEKVLLSDEKYSIMVSDLKNKINSLL